MPIQKKFIHEWLIFPFDFDYAGLGKGCPIAIHRDVVKTSAGLDADHSTHDPEEDVLRFGPGTCASALKSIDDLHVDVNTVYMLVDEGYIDGAKAHLIFHAQ